ncbi:hypothetical protein [uncultured Ferrovibrio sp.]|uniref:hypothetical protein n=1 Tax=uncultured Ferrovibrio sp. TaxID=1576913 RepID=UPI002606558A|nr:hypothetical protein [uncultured Ferrovibrio sp.]
MDDPKATDPEALAQRFLDLWQEQASLLATDPKLAELSAAWLALWQRGAGVAAQAAGGMALGQGGVNAGGQKGGAGTSGATAAAAASGDSQHDLAELYRRLADCEARIAALESQLGGSVRKPRTSTRRRKPE